jgi:heparin/heparan-sulfate lyase
VLPESAVVTKVGGEGKECWVDGRNWPAVEQKWTRDAGSWRLEVSPSKPAKEDFFLHILQTDGDEIAAPDAVALTQERGGIGVRVRAQGREYQVTFSTTGASARLRVSEKGKVVLEKELR